MHSDLDLERERLVVTFSRDLTLQDITEMVRISAKAGVLHFKLLADARTAPFDLMRAEYRPLQRSSPAARRQVPPGTNRGRRRG